MKPCDENIKKTLELAKDMLSIAEKGDADREDDGCGIATGEAMMLAPRKVVRFRCSGALRNWINNG